MTPSQTRQRGYRSLRSAAYLLEQGETDIAAYLAGNAAELLLKARYLSKNGLAALPTERNELRKHALNEHRLENLLTLCQGDVIHRQSLDAIDWRSVAEWHNQDRYEPIGSIDAAKARLRIEQTDLLFKAFVHHEIVESLEKSEAALAAEGIVFNLFAWVRWPGNQWKLNIATKWLDAEETRLARVAHIREINAKFLAPDLQHQIQAIDFDGVGDQTPCAFYNFSRSGTGGMTMRNGTFFGGGRLGPPVRNSATFAVDNIRTDSGAIDRAYVIALQPPSLDGTSGDHGAPNAPG